jgi:hypothetical protein
MQRPTDVLLLFTILLVCSPTLIKAQEDHPNTTDGIADLKTLVVATETKSGSVIAMPPVTSATISLGREKKRAGAGAGDLPNWVRKEATLNGLQSTDSRPWHIIVNYDQFSKNGDRVHSGVYEEYWAGTTKYKRIYRSDNFNQTDYATEKGLYRRGDQRWPDRAQSQVRAEVIDPFYYVSTLRGFDGSNIERTFSGYKLQCVVIERDSSMSDPTQYCFEPGSSILRYARGFGWFQTVYNRIVLFQNRNLAQEVDVTDGGKPYLKLRVETIELIPQVDDADFLPPLDAVGPLGGRVSGVSPEPVNISSPPQWPPSLRAQHFTVGVEIVIGTDGHVVSAHAISGPPKGYKACESAVRKWVFRPYLVLDKPVEVELKVECSNN